jgi:nitrogen fixation/metabolism regulation signal transduction histidine kinase
MSLVFGILFPKPEYFFSQLILGIIIVLLTVEMIHFARNSSRELTKFILAIKYGDVSVNFSGNKLGRNFKELAGSFREVIQAYNQVKIEKESQYQLLQAIIDKISFGLIAFNEDEEILLINQSALDGLKIERTKDWNYIKKHRADFTDQIEHMVRDGRKLVELNEGSDTRHLSVYNHALVLMEKQCRVVTFYDIQDEIEQKEIEAWYKLIRILTHEIMNSVTPLTSLTETILMLLEDHKGEQKSINDITDTNIKDVRSSVSTINKRTVGILKFVDAYRKLTDIPHPEFEQMRLMDLFHSAASLFEVDFKKRKIDLSCEIIPEDLVVHCDKNLMEQVLINLLSNSMYALENSSHPIVKVMGYVHQSRFILQVEDNGKGIEENILQKIFIPFFSTREGGSGIGLSFSKFVILQHGGRIKVESKKDVGTKFIIDLPKR